MKQQVTKIRLIASGLRFTKERSGIGMGGLGALLLVLATLSGCSATPDNLPLAESSTRAHNHKSNPSDSQDEQHKNQVDETPNDPAEPECQEGQVLRDGECVTPEPSCPDGIVLPEEVDPSLVCGQDPSGTIQIPEITTEGEYAYATAILPSGNIGCQDSGDHFSCNVSEHDWEEIPVDDRPTVGVCSGYAFGSDRSLSPECWSQAAAWALVSYGDIPGYNVILEYGHVYRFPSGYLCHSETTGLACWDPLTRHGFQLSRGNYAQW